MIKANTKPKPKNENKMNLSYTPVNTAHTIRKSQIETFKDFSNAGVILMDDDVMQKIKTQSGPLAPSCEYQVHYWSMVCRIKFQDNSLLDICIPTVFFNYKQEVSGARIDFELSDVDEVSNKLLPVHNIKINELLKSDIIDRIEALFPNTELSVLSTNLNSIHKHPGGINQSFSGTDLAADSTHNTGIVFPLAEGENKPNFAGIMAHVGDKNKVAHFEYRLATGKIDPTNPKSKLEYVRGRCLGIIRAKPSKPIPEVVPSTVEYLFGITGTPAIPAKSNTYYTTNEIKIDSLSQVFSDIQLIWEESKFMPFTDSVIPDNIQAKKFNYGKTVHGAKLHGLYDDEEDCDDLGWYKNYLSKRDLVSNKNIINTNISTASNATKSDFTKSNANNMHACRVLRDNDDPTMLEHFLDQSFLSDTELITVKYPDLEFECKWLEHLLYDEDFEDSYDQVFTLVDLKIKYRQLKTLFLSRLNYLTEYDEHITMDGEIMTRAKMLSHLIPKMGNDIEFLSLREIKEEFEELFITDADMQDDDKDIINDASINLS